MHDHFNLHVPQAFEDALYSEYGTGYTEFQICLIMTPYASIIPEYASVFLNIP